MTVERRKVIQIGTNKTLPVPFTRRECPLHSVFEFKSPLTPRQVSIDGSPVFAGDQTASSRIAVLAPDAVFVNYKVSIDDGITPPTVLVEKKGVLNRDEINFIPPTKSTIKTLFQHKP